MDDKEFEELENKYYEEKHKRDEKQKLISKIKEVEKEQVNFFKEDGFTRIERFVLYAEKIVCYDRDGRPESERIEIARDDVEEIFNFYLTRLKNKLKLMEEN